MKLFKTIMFSLTILMAKEVICLNLINKLAALNQTGFQPASSFSLTNSINDTNFFDDSQTRKSEASDVSCPISCRCYIKTVAQCTRSSLTQMPCDIEINRGQNVSYRSVFSSHLQDLYLSNNQIREIHGSCIVVSGRSLQTLSLHHNEIASIAADAFRSFNRLKVLDLSDNQLTTLSQEGAAVFEYLSDSLTVLYLSRNRITSVPENSFVGFRSLRTLSLSRNRIRWIARAAFADLSSLEFLELRGNPLMSTAVSRISLNLVWFSTRYYELSPNHGAYIINVSSCEPTSAREIIRSKRQNYVIEQMTSEVENSNASRHYQRKESETLLTLDLGDLQLTQVPQGFARTLKFLFLDKNRISGLRKFDFSEMHSLQYLHLAHNNIQNISASTFSSLTSLHTLDLSSNDLFHLDSLSFCGLVTLSSLRLHNNPRLATLPDKIFDGNQLLKILYLQDCGLRELPSGAWLQHLNRLWLYGNPLLCSCTTIIPLLRRIHYGYYFRERFLFDVFSSLLSDADVWEEQRPERTRCSYPMEWSGVALDTLSFWNFSCSPKELSEMIKSERIENPFEFFINMPDADVQADFLYTSTEAQLNEAEWLSKAVKLSNSTWMDKILSPDRSNRPNDSELYNELLEYYNLNNNYIESRERVNEDNGVVYLEPDNDDEILGHHLRSNDTNQAEIENTNIIENSKTSGQSLLDNKSNSPMPLSNQETQTNIELDENITNNVTESYIVSHNEFFEITKNSSTYQEPATANYFDSGDGFYLEDTVNLEDDSHKEVYDDSNEDKEYWETYDADYNSRLSKYNATVRDEWWKLTDMQWLGGVVLAESFETDFQKWLNQTTINEVFELLSESIGDDTTGNNDVGSSPLKSFTHHTHLIHFHDLPDPVWDET